MPRLFVAIDAPDAVRDLLAALKKNADGVKWVPKEQLHFTLRFIGDFEDVARISETLRGVFAPRFTIKISGVGQFPPKRAARVLWAGISPVQEISTLAAEIDRRVVACGVASEDREFSPHLTLARIKDSRGSSFVKSFIEEHGALASDPFEVDRFFLYQSELSSKGARHTVLETVTL